MNSQQNDLRNPVRRGPVRCAFGVVAALCVALVIGHPAHGDAITIEGETFKNVIVKEGISLYYVQFPEDGTVKAVSKARVAKSDVHLSRSKKEQRELLAKWKENRAASMSTQTGLPPAPTVDNRVASEPRNRIDPGPKILTNRSSVEQAARQNRPVFVGPSGVAVLTNKPDAYRGQSEYIEMKVHYATIVVPAKFKNTQTESISTPDDVREIVRHYCSQYGVPENLVLAVMKAESNFDPTAVSPAGARGLMQLMPGTAAEMGVTDLFDPVQNIAGGTQYLSKMMDLFDGNLTLALAAYNAGPGAVAKHHGVPPYSETKAYIRRVQANLHSLEKEGARLVRLAKVQRPRADYLPEEINCRYMIQFRNGFTQPAEAIEPAGDSYYLVQYKGLTTRIRKEDVKQIKETA